MPLTPGTRVGPYEVVALLGAGGMAEVYRAKDTRLGRMVALKMVAEALGTDAALVERFEREAKLAGLLNHPNVVALYDVGFQDGKPYFVTELLQGESLRERLANGPLQLASALEWAAQMAQGLAAAHERGIVHRDLKPENVFVTKDGPIKLIDFGIAKLIEAAREAGPHGLMDETASPSGSNTGTGMVLGTPGYMSPEQVRGDVVDERTDIFSFGSVLYEMLSGKRAFAADSVVERGYAILHGEVEPLPAITPPAVTRLVHRCLEKDPQRRFQSAYDLAFYLDVVRTPAGASQQVATTQVTASTASRRRLRRGLLAGGLAAFVLAGIGAAYVLGSASRRPVLFEEQITFRRGRVSAARFNPDGRVVFSAAWEGQPLELFAKTLGSLDEAQPLGLREVALLSVSVKGEQAVLLRPEWFGRGLRGTLAVVPADGGAPREVAENVVFADWSSTGELAVVRDIGGMSRLEFPLGMPLVESGELIFNPRVSPNGAEVAFIRNVRAGPELVVVDRQGRTRRLANVAFGTGLAWTPSGDEVWFSSYDNAIRASSRVSGGKRLVYQGVSNIRLDDISREGRALVNVENWRLEVAFVPADGKAERRLSLWDSFLVALSSDGRRVLFTSYTFGTVAYLRPIDGSSAVKLGQGVALALSPDEKWVLVHPSEGESGELSLLPVGPGKAATVPVAGIDVYAARFLHDGKHIVFTGRASTEKTFRLYRLLLDGGVPEPISKDAVIRGLVKVSDDDRFVAAVDGSDILTVYPLDGGPPVSLPELGKDAAPVHWTAEGDLWVRPNSLREVPNRILRYDIRKRRVLEERSVTLADTTGVMAFFEVLMAPEDRGFAVGYQRSFGELHILSGLAPAWR
jgi:eukaryotic-like serine/threonine-protein kinase